MNINASVVVPNNRFRVISACILLAVFVFGSCDLPVPVNTIPPVANAGPDQEVEAGTPVTLNGSGTAAAGTSITSWHWEQTDGPPAQLGANNTARVTFAAPHFVLDTPDRDTHKLVFELTVTGSNGQIHSDSVIVIVSSPQTLTADAGSDQTNVLGGATVTLNGSNSTPAKDGKIIKHSWKQESGPVEVYLEATDDPAIVTFVAPRLIGDTLTLAFELTVTGNNGETDKATLMVTIPDVPRPIADAGTDQTVLKGTRVTLDGSGSSSAEVGIPITYSWKQTEGPNVTLSGSSAENPTFVAHTVTTSSHLVFELTVTGSNGETDKATVTVMVTAVPPPIPDAGSDQAVIERVLVTLDGRASKAADGTSIKLYSWVQIDGEPVVTLMMANTKTPSFTAPIVTTDTNYVFRLTVTGSDDIIAIDEVTITVSPAPIPKAVASANKLSVTVGGSVTLNASGSTIPLGVTIESYSWRQTGGTSVDLDSTDPSAPRFTAPDVDTSTDLVFELTIRGSNGETSTATITITVSPNPVPIAHVTVDDTSVTEGDEVTLNGSGSSAATPASSITYSWRQTKGPNVELSDDSAGIVTFVAPLVTRNRSLEFELTVTDSNGETARAETDSIIVSPVADADGDGFIEIFNLEGLHNMRYNLEGTSYKTSESDTGDNSGCPTTGCTGYELIQNLDFDTDGNGTWTGNSTGGFTLDPSDDNNTYFDVQAGGWVPIGTKDAAFTATFEGNGYTISNLAIQRNAEEIGFFGHTENATIRNVGLIDNLLDYIGSLTSEYQYIGGLAGRQTGGTITASYTTGPANGATGSRDYVGGLVGIQNATGNIIASYATGNVNAGTEGGTVGGLVGLQLDGAITASYATGNADGSDGNVDHVGGLVGRQLDGSITASYATGSVNGGAGNNDNVGGLVGWQQQGSIAASYATGNADGGAGNSDHVGGLVGSQYFSGSITASYATGSVDGDFVGRLLGYQHEGVYRGTITASYGFGPVTGRIRNYYDTLVMGARSNAQLTRGNVGDHWNSATHGTSGAWDFRFMSQSPALKYADYDDSGSDYSCDMFPDPNGPDGSNLCGTTIPGSDSTPVVALPPVDADSDGLIEISTLGELHNMHYNLAGTSYKTSASGVGNDGGCPATGCFGYELTQNLNFDTNGNGHTWKGNSEDGFELDADDQAVYFSSSGGWRPIGSASDMFTATFDGNGHTISNLAIRRPGAAHTGFFKRIGGNAVIRNIGLINNLVDNNGSNDGNAIGGLVGEQTGGSIIASYVTGTADGSGGINDNVGGLVGRQTGGSIIASYATGVATGVIVIEDHVTTGSGDYVGGLVGRQNGGSITASYATVNVKGGTEDYDYIGGLVGRQNGGSITASYATGTADGGDGANDNAGGLVGEQNGGSITASYGFGTVRGEEVSNTVGTPPSGVTAATGLTPSYAGSQWNATASDTRGAWNFGTTSQTPALQYADYDGPSGSDYSCSIFPTGKCNTIIPGQGR